MKQTDLLFFSKKFIFLLIFLILVLVSSAQPTFVWAKQIGGIDLDRGKSIALDKGGNVYTTGYFSKTADFDPGATTFSMSADTGTIDMFISKLDPSGNFIWAKKVSGTDIDEGVAMVVDDSGNVYITGSFFGKTDFDTGPGSDSLTSAGDRDIFIMKLNTSGDLVWVKQIGEANADYGLSIAVDTSGNVYTSGAFQFTADFDPGAGTANLTSVGSYDIFISKLDRNGNFIWAKQMGAVNDDYANSLVLDASRNIYITGSFNGTMDADPGIGVFPMTSTGDDIFVSKLDTLGNLVWAKQFAGAVNEEANAITVDAFGNVFTSGLFDGTVDFDPNAGTFNMSVSSGGIRDIFVSKLNASGNFVWAKQMGGTALFADYSSSIAVDVNCNVYTTGMFFGTVDFDPGIGNYDLTSGLSGYYGDIFINILDASGNFKNAGKLGGGGTNDNLGSSIVVDAIGNIYTTGSFDGTNDFDPGAPTYSFTGSEDIFISKLNGGVGVGNNEIEDNNLFSIFPNPSKGKFYIENDHFNAGNCRVNIYNSLGEKLENVSIGINTEIDLSGYPKGIYFLQMNTENRSLAKKIVLE